MSNKALFARPLLKIDHKAEGLFSNSVSVYMLHIHTCYEENREYREEKEVTHYTIGGGSSVT